MALHRSTPALLLAAVLSACTLHKAPVQEVDPREVVPGLIEVEFRGRGPGQRAALAPLGELVSESWFDEQDTDLLLPAAEAGGSVFVVHTAEDPAATAAALAALRARPDVLYAEPVLRLHLLSWTPDDPGFSKQWHLRAAGAPQAWEMARGAGVAVAVIDTGVAPVDDLDPARLRRGHNFLPGARPDDATDDHGHGTHVAGTIAQSTGNGVGVAGMAPDAEILPLKVLGASGAGTSAGISEAIRYAADHGARVLNLSLGGGGRSEAMAAAVRYAHRKGCTVVAAAGNSGGKGVSFPAAYDGAFAVSATGPQGKLAPYSSYGPEVALAAPGGDKSQGEEQGVLQETLGEDGKAAYRWFQGTSMATPHVAGAAALLYSVGVTNPSAVERLLRETALPAPEGNGSGRPDSTSAELYGSGLLDAGAALRTATLWWGLCRLVLALAGALVAVAHARKLGQLRTHHRLGGGFWTALVVGAGALAALAPLGLARLPVLSALALPPAGMAARLLGLPGTALGASLAAWLGWSAAGPFVLALVARGAARGQGASASTVASLAAGFSFGWAGLLLHAALVRSVWLPLLPSFLVPAWLVVGAAISWGAGRGLLAREALR
jgi:serine protease